MPGDFHIGAKGLLTRNTEILMLRSGTLWDLPGGRIEEAEDPIAALYRELSEELPGIQEVRIGELIGWHRSSTYRVPDRELVLMIFQVWAIVPDPIQLSEEHDHAAWLPQSEARQILGESSVQWGRLK